MNSYILATDLRSILVRQGDVMTDEEADQFIGDCDPMCVFKLVMLMMLIKLWALCHGLLISL